MNQKRNNGQLSFLCIGAQRAGTTWLHARLNELSEFAVPPVKELHYFDRDISYNSPNLLSEPYLNDRIKNISWIKKVIRSYIKQIIKLDFEQFKWLNKFYFSQYNDDWYLSLFKDLPGGLIRGEVTPSYSILNPSDVKKVHTLLPNVKIIFLLRNPIDRAWSHYKLCLKLYPEITSEMKSIDFIFEFLERTTQELRSDYFRTISNYRMYFPANQMLIGFYDAIKDKPYQLLSDIVEFLGGDASAIASECNLNAKDNVSPEVTMPVEVRRFLENKYRPILKRLSEDFGSYCTQWYDDTATYESPKRDKRILKPTQILSFFSKNIQFDRDNSMSKHL